MGWMQNCGYIAVLLVSFLSPFTVLCSSYHASESAGGRNLLQMKKPCPVNFEIQNYTIITSQCKGPEYPPKKCCDAFLQFACKYADELNDGTTDCADTMFSYINLYGKYPPGLFASECRGDKNKGIKCDEKMTKKTDSPGGAAASLAGRNASPPLLLLAPAFLLLLMCFV